MEFILHSRKINKDFTFSIPEDCLATYAQEKNIHLIILGSQTDSLGLDMFCGSVVERIVSLTPCPVLVAKKR